MASRSVNKVILLGHLGKDAETKFTPSGVAKTSFTVATNRRWKDQQSGEWKEVTDWHNVVLWRSENVANYLLKGKQVYVEGRLETRSWEDQQSGQKKYMTEVVADDVILLGGGGRGGEDFTNRGRRSEEQIEVLRRLWTEPVVDFEGRWHRIPAAGINPLPVQRPIPVWIGGSAEAAIRRTARLADGFFPQRPLEGGWPATMERFRGWIEEAGRDPAEIGVE